MNPLRHPVAAIAPGVLALAVATVALVRSGDEDPPAPRTASAPAAPSGAAPPSFAELVDRVDGTVARIDARRGPNDPPFGNGRRVATGAAFLVDDEGHVVTNAHVVDRARSASVRFGRSSRRIPARIVGADRATDLAVLRVDPSAVRGEEPLALAPRGSIEVGEPVLAVGTPFRLQGSATAGIVSATGRTIQGLTGFSIPDAVQTDAAINPGNSGGPLVDAQGRVVGVNAQGRAAGVSFAISADTVRRVVPQLIDDGRAETAYLGVGVGEVTDRGTRIASTAAGGPAAEAGLRAGDVVVSIGGRPTTEDGALPSAIAAHRPAERVAVRIRRDGRDRTITVRLGRQPASSAR
jgi:putative serine protease PepD